MQCNFSKLRMSFATFGKRHCICSFVHESLSKENRFLQKPEKISSFFGGLKMVNPVYTILICCWRQPWNCPKAKVTVFGPPRCHQNGRNSRTLDIYDALSQISRKNVQYSTPTPLGNFCQNALETKLFADSVIDTYVLYRAENSFHKKFETTKKIFFLF